MCSKLLKVYSVSSNCYPFKVSSVCPNFDVFPEMCSMTCVQLMQLNNTVGSETVTFSQTLSMMYLNLVGYAVYYCNSILP